MININLDLDVWDAPIAFSDINSSAPRDIFVCPICYHKTTSGKCGYCGMSSSSSDLHQIWSTDYEPWLNLCHRYLCLASQDDAYALLPPITSKSPLPYYIQRRIDDEELDEYIRQHINDHNWYWDGISHSLPWDRKDGEVEKETWTNGDQETIVYTTYKGRKWTITINLHSNDEIDFGGSLD